MPLGLIERPKENDMSEDGGIIGFGLKDEERTTVVGTESEKTFYVIQCIYGLTFGVGDVINIYPTPKIAEEKKEEMEKDCGHAFQYKVVPIQCKYKQ